MTHSKKKRLVPHKTEFRSRVPLSYPQIALAVASLVYLVMFWSALYIRGLDQAVAFSRGTRDAFAMVWVCAMVYRCYCEVRAMLLWRWYRAHVTLLRCCFLSVLLNVFMPVFMSGYTAILRGMVNAFVAMVHAVGVEWLVVGLMLVNVIVYLALGLYFDRNLTFQVILHIWEALQNAMVAVCQKFTNPRVLLAYLLFYFMVSLFPRLPDALKEALLKDDNQACLSL